MGVLAGAAFGSLSLGIQEALVLTRRKGVLAREGECAVLS